VEILPTLLPAEDTVTTRPRPSIRSVREPDADDIGRAAAIVRRHLPPTPVVASPGLGPGIVLKLETLQPTGSFKVRGALAAVAAAVAEEADRPVVTASAGNHGLGVAYAARTFGARAIVVIPENASEAKRAALAAFAIEIVRHGRSFEEAEAHALALAAGAGARYISAYNDPDVIAGQATMALELFDQVPGLTTIIAPLGGGGLLAGLALAVADRDGDTDRDGEGARDRVGVRGVEADASPAVSASVAAGRVVPVAIGATVADGLAGNVEPGSVTVPMIAVGVEQLAGVDEESIGRAVRFLAVEHGLVVEPSGAVAVAGLLAGRVTSGPGPTAVAVTGRNITLELLGRLLGAAP
jgi:threonine dehydratase